MDPIPDLPPMNTGTPPHSAPSANPTQSPATNGAHPPYAEMITTAIATLNDKDGSSRQAIARYIEKEYQNLPPTHSALLTHHLKRLKNEGQLLIVKHSYMLPPAGARSAHFQPPTSAAYNQDPDYSATPAENPSSVTSKRRGRPPKHRPDLQTPMPNVQSIDAAGEIHPYQPRFEQHYGDAHDFQHQNTQPAYDYAPVNQATSAGAADPIFVSLGLADDGIAPTPENPSVSAKRGRGRPPKLAAVRGSVGGSGAGAGAGAGVVAASGDGGTGTSTGTGTGGSGAVGGGRRGRPRKAGRLKFSSVIMGNGGVAKRGRGRPRRIGIGAVTVPLSGNVMRPTGRPKRAIGRPRGAGASMVRDLNAQPLGRPSKVGPGTAVLVTDPNQLVVYQELKQKYELLQSKVKEVVNVVKPYLSSEYENAALGALQELEGLADVAPQDRTQNPTSSVQN